MDGADTAQVAEPDRAAPAVARGTPSTDEQIPTFLGPGVGAESKGVLHPNALLWLQRSAGNAAVAEMLGGARPGPVRAVATEGDNPTVQRDSPTAQRDQPTVQRDPPTATAPAGAPGATGGAGGAAPPGADTALSSAQTIQGAAAARLLKVAAYNTASDTAIAAYRNKRTAYAAAWGGAWERHRGTLAAAKADADQENLVEGVVIGVVAGILVAAAATALFPVAAGAAAFSAGWVAFNVGGSVAGSVGGTIVQTAVATPDPGSPTGGKQDASNAAWQAVAGVEDASRSVASLAPRFGLELGNAEYAIAQVQAAIAGSPTDMNWDQTLQMVSTMMGWESGVKPFDGQLDDKLQAMMKFGDAAQTWPTPTVDSLEVEIWRAWLAQLTNKDVLGHRLFGNPVHDRLVALGLLSDTWWVSDSDKDKAIADAKGKIAAASAAGPTPP